MAPRPGRRPSHAPPKPRRRWRRKPAAPWTATGAIVPPIHVATTFVRDADNQYRRGYCYGRSDNATVRQVEHVLTELEQRRGEPAVRLRHGRGDEQPSWRWSGRRTWLRPRQMYWGLRQWLTQDAPSHGLDVTFVDAGDMRALGARDQAGTHPAGLDRDAVEPDLGRHGHCRGGALRRMRPARCWPSTPRCSTPVLTRPIALGADIVVHSATKYLNGHSDVVAGALVFARKDATYERAARLRGMLGAILGPFEAALLLRGLRTLHVRVRHQSAAAMAIAEHFASHPAVAGVLYPGLASHPGHAVAARQMQGGFGGMLSMHIKGGEAAAICRRRRACRCGSGRPRWAASKAWSSTGRASRGRIAHVRPICCASRSALKALTI